MARYANKEIVSLVQVLDSDGNPANDAVVHFVIYDGDEESDSGDMAYISESAGLYITGWTPTEAGEWTIVISCSNPKFYKAFSYNVANPDALVWTYHTQWEWDVQMTWPPGTGFANLLYGSKGIRPYLITFWWDNDEHTDERTFSFQACIDGVLLGNQQDLMTSNIVQGQHTYYLKLNPAGEPQFVCDADDKFTMFGPAAGFGDVVSDRPFECHTFYFQIAFDDVDGAGTNPWAKSSQMWQTLDPINYG
jgi:hypothetical protein